jgi:hypothetical protein
VSNHGAGAGRSIDVRRGEQPESASRFSIAEMQDRRAPRQPQRHLHAPRTAGDRMRSDRGCRWVGERPDRIAAIDGQIALGGCLA